MFLSAFRTSTGTVTATALATFYYTGLGSGTDNLWWSSAVSGTNNIVVSSALINHDCGTPGSGTPSAYEQIEVDLSGQYCDIELHDWNDWNEAPLVIFSWVDPPSRVQEPQQSRWLVLACSAWVSSGVAVARK
jgi:hypothetical protein